MSTETEIRAVITQWVDAIVDTDIDGVMANHTDDIVMFDVPPPYDGVRGTAAYRDSWPPFFDYIRSGATFEIVELNVVTSADVAFAYGLLRCGGEKEFAANLDNRLRLTMGLRRDRAQGDDRWLIVHEHHSFPHTA